MNTDTSMAAPVRMEPELTIYSAAQVHQLLMAMLQSGAVLELDLADVCEIDSAGVQLLVAARREAAARGGELTLCGHSPAVQDAFALLGLDAQCTPLHSTLN